MCSPSEAQLISLPPSSNCDPCDPKWINSSTKCLIRGRLFPWRTGQALRHPCRFIWSFPGLLTVVSDYIFILPFNGYTMETLVERLWSSFCWKLEVSSLSLLPDHSKHFQEQRICVELPPAYWCHSTMSVVNFTLANVKMKPLSIGSV